MQFTHKASLALVFLSAATLNVAPAYAQDAKLTLGQADSATAFGTATLDFTGTTADHTYTYDSGYSNGAFDDAAHLAAQTNYNQWDTYGPSTANVQGGTIKYLLTHSSSIGNVSGGTITDTFATGNSSIGNVSGGDIHELRTLDSSTANVSGGNISFMDTFFASTATISGGSVDSLTTSHNSFVTVSGGKIGALGTFDTSVLNLLGTGLTETFEGNFGTSQEYALTGTLNNGDLLNVMYDHLGGTLEFNGQVINPVPEASTTISFGLLLALGMGSVMVAAKRKKHGS